MDISAHPMDFPGIFKTISGSAALPVARKLVVQLLHTLCKSPSSSGRVAMETRIMGNFYGFDGI